MTINSERAEAGLPPLPNGSRPAPAYSPAMMPPPQRWMCAVCAGAYRAWQQANEEAIANAALQAAASGRPLAAFLAAPARESMPPAQEAITLATIPGHGPALVCLGHCPVIGDGTGRRPLLVATAGMNPAAFAAGMG
jgi:hypothetical protein